MAFRVTWRNNEEVIWRQILSHRVECDKFMKNVPGISLFVSAITGTVGIGKPPTAQKVVFPGISYWVVPFAIVNPWVILRNFQDTLKGQAEVRFLREPPIINTLDVMQSTMCNVLKDHNNTYIEQRMEACLREHGHGYPYAGVAARIVANSQDLTAFAKEAEKAMDLGGVRVNVVQYD